MTAEPALPETTFLGVRFTPLTLDEAVAAIRARPADAPFAYVVTPNAHHVVAARQGDPWFVDAQAGAWMLLNDSATIHRLARRLFRFDLPLATGADLVAGLFAAGVPPETPVTIIGGDDEMEHRLREDFGLRRIARHAPPMGFHEDEGEIERCVAFVRDHPARYVFFVVGAPQSEMLAWRVSRLEGVSGLGLCVGSALNFLTGVVPRAPEFWRRRGLEWLYRLAQRPRGHARRVFVQSAPVLWLILRERLATPWR